MLISEKGDTPLRRTPLRGLKRKRTVIEDTKQDAFQTTSRATGELEIVDECPEGGFIRIENKGAKVSWLMNNNIPEVFSPFGCTSDMEHIHAAFHTPEADTKSKLRAKR